MQLEIIDAVGDGSVRSRQETCADAVGDIAKPEVEARRLDLAGQKILRRQDRTRFRERMDHGVRQNASFIGIEDEVQNVVSSVCS